MLSAAERANSDTLQVEVGGQAVQFAATAEGSALRDKLERSELMHRAHLVFDFGTLSLLEDNPPEILPSAYIDVLFMLGGSERADDVLEQLFKARSE